MPPVRKPKPSADLRYVALLRGINVGGKNLIKMPALKECFEAQGFEDVLTYIASGNVLFRAAGSDRAALTRRIESCLSKAFAYESRIVLRSTREMDSILARRPRGFGEKPGEYRYDVVFLKEPLTAKDALGEVNPKEGVDEVFAGSGVLYFSRFIPRAKESRLGRIMGLSIYQSMTIRNWNTTTKLAALLAEPR
jgi:uncharacterized protein (DUF1697 family)